MIWGIVDWNHVTELLKQHSGSKWHRDSSVTVRMAKHVGQQNVIEMQCAGAAKQAEEQKKKNRGMISLWDPYISWLRIVFHTQPHAES